MKNLFFVLLSAVLMAIAWPGSIFPELVFAALVPLFYVLLNERSVWRSGGLFYLFYTVFLFLTHWEMFWLEGSSRIIQLSVGLFVVPLFWSTPALLTAWIRKKTGSDLALILFPLLFVLQEILHFYWDLDYVESHLGFGAAQIPSISFLYPLGGLEIVAFVILGVNGLFAYALYKKRLRLLWSLPVLIAVSVAIRLFGWEYEPKLNSRKSMDLVLYQPDTAEYNSSRNDLDAQIDRFVRSIDFDSIAPGSLILAPESFFSELDSTPLFTNTLGNQKAIVQLNEISKKYRVGIISGSKLVELFKTRKAPSSTAKIQGEFYFEIYNGSFFINADKVEWRSKKKLVPFTEKVPMIEVSKTVGEWTGLIDVKGMYGVSNNYKPYKFRGVSIVPLVCFESLFPCHAAQIMSKKNNLLLVMSNRWTKSKIALERQRIQCSALSKCMGVPLVLISEKGLLYSTFSNSNISQNTSNTVSLRLSPSLRRSFYSNVVTVMHILWLCFTVFFAVWLLSKKVR